MPKSEDLLKLEEALAGFDTRLHLAQTDNEGDESSDGGDDGTGSIGGQGGVEIEKRLFVEVFSLLRQGEKEFGPTNEFDPIKYLNKDTRSLKGELGQSAGLKQHPTLGNLSKFDGDTPDMSIPDRHPEAQESYQHRLTLQMSKQNQLQQDMTPRPSPGRGM